MMKNNVSRRSFLKAGSLAGLWGIWGANKLYSSPDSSADEPDLLRNSQINFGKSRRVPYRPVKPVFPAPDGYVTLLADLHMHTVFSDGLVWPTMRVSEAHREGLDVIAITDHIEYTPYTKDVPFNLSRSYELAAPAADRSKILLIPGLEITRGRQNQTGDQAIKHINCLFLKDFNALNVPVMKEAVYAAAEQGAFICWNHPSWAQVDNKCVWYPEMDEFIKAGVLKGFEVVNGTLYEPDVIEWSQRHKTAMLGCTDAHELIGYSYNFMEGEHRPMTLIFAKERTLSGIRDALENKRTAVYAIVKRDGFWLDMLIGNEEWLKVIFNAGVRFKSIIEKPSDGVETELEIENTLPLDVLLKAINRDKPDMAVVQEKIVVPARSKVKIRASARGLNSKIVFQIVNFQISKTRFLETEFIL